MEYVLVHALTNDERKKIDALVLECSNIEGIQYSVYTGDGIPCDDVYELCYADEQQLIGFMGCFVSDTAEITGIVHPEYRLRNIFSDMLEHINSWLEELMVTHVEFSGRSSYSGYTECALALGCNGFHNELLMKYNPKDYEPEGMITYEAIDEDGYTRYCFYNEGEEVGHCNIFAEPSRINIFEVYVANNKRQQGYGHQIIDTVLSLHRGQNIVLQVSGENEPACRLYASCGFSIIDSVMFFTLS